MRYKVWFSGQGDATRVSFERPPGADAAQTLLATKDLKVYWSEQGTGTEVATERIDNPELAALLCRALGAAWFLFEKRPIEVFVPQLWGMPKKLAERPIFYGGSFRPWHLGHRACVRAAINPEDVVVLPDQNPHKMAVQENAWDRYRKLVQLLTDESCSVFPGFAGWETPNPTWSWVQRVNGSVRLLLGLDSFLALPTWYRSEELVSRVDEWQVVPRGPGDMTKVMKWIKYRNAQVQIRILKSHDYESLSSTQLRLR